MMGTHRVNQAKGASEMQDAMKAGGLVGQKGCLCRKEKEESGLDGGCGDSGQQDAKWKERERASERAWD